MSGNPNPVRVLSLDGGGIHGVMPATILAYIEQKSAKPVSELFDLIVGTSTGGILSLGFGVPNPDGTPKFSAEALRDLYRTKAGQIFKPFNPATPLRNVDDRIVKALLESKLLDEDDLDIGPLTPGAPLPWWRGLFHAKYSADGIEGFLSEQFGDTPLSGPVGNCSVAVNSFDLDAYDLAMLRSWEAEADPDRDFQMWAAARATSAAPTYFPAANIQSINGKASLHGVDGAMAVNDPVLVGLAEARKLLEARGTAPMDTPVFVVSIGTGQKTGRSIPYDRVHDAGLIGWAAHGLIDVLMEGANIAANQLAERLLPDDAFYRFQPALTGPGFTVTSAIDDWSASNISAMVAAAENFVEQNRATLDKATERLLEGGNAVA